MIHDIIKAKNMDLLLHKHNHEADTINSSHELIDEKVLRDTKNSYENLLARIDTDRHTTKKDGKYSYNIPIDTTKLVGLKGIKQTINIRGI